MGFRPKFSMCVLKVLIEESASQIFHLGLSFDFV